MASAIVLPTGNVITGDPVVDAITVAKTEISALQAVAPGLAANTGTAIAVAGAATLSKSSGIVTSEALTTAADAAYVLTITNTLVTAASLVTASVQFGTSTTGEPVIMKVAPGVGSLVITVKNVAAAAALNGTIKVTFVIHS